jgi:hypothetical protein
MIGATVGAKADRAKMGTGHSKIKETFAGVAQRVAVAITEAGESLGCMRTQLIPRVLRKQGLAAS